MGAPAIALCPSCERETLPRLAQPSWHREKHRAPKADRDGPSDPRAERIKNRKARRNSLRSQIKLKGLIETTKIFLALKGQPMNEAPSEDCERCLKLQSR